MSLQASSLWCVYSTVQYESLPVKVKPKANFFRSNPSSPQGRNQGRLRSTCRDGDRASSDQHIEVYNRKMRKERKGSFRIQIDIEVIYAYLKEAFLPLYPIG